MPTLVIRGSNGDVREVRVDSRTITIGRDPSCDVTIDDRLVSRRHMTLSHGLVAQDESSFNGVYVRGRRVERAFLTPGESFFLGAEERYEVQVLEDSPDLLWDLVGADRDHAEEVQLLKKRIRALERENSRLRLHATEGKEGRIPHRAESSAQGLDRPSTIRLQHRSRKRRGNRMDTPTTSGTTG